MKRLLSLASLSALLLPLVLGGQDAQEKKAKGPEVGKPAPTLRLNDQSGRAVSVGGKSESWTVLAFFPKAATPGWTLEMCSLRDAATDFEAMGVDVYGASLDDVKDLKAFADAQKLEFPLLSDPDGGVARKYGVLAEGASWAGRVTFVIDDKGVLRKIDDGVQVKSHGEDLLLMVEQLMAE